MRKSSRPIVVLALLALAIAAVYYLYRGRQEPQPRPLPASGKLVVHFLDVGQGDAELVRLPGSGWILIDSGDSGAPTVELLKKLGVGEIDLVIATHPHQDHIGEMRDVMRAFKVNEFWDAGFAHPTKTYTNMLQEIKDRGIRFTTPKRGETRQFGQVLLEVLNPGRDLPDDNPNNASLVVRLTFGSRRFLFTGDAEVESWGQMLGSSRDGLRADLLKAAHHGSSNGTTEDVLDAVRPSIVTISCAAGNDYHHPHPRVVDMLERHRDTVQPYRTDLQGEITVTTDGAMIEVSTEKQVGADRLYLTGDEVAGKVAGDGSGAGNRRRRSR